MNEPKDRITYILDDMGISARQFAMNLGINPHQIYDIQRGKVASISSRLADMIVGKFPKYNKAWIITGIGEPSTSSCISEKNVPENGLFVPAELVQMFGDMAATIRSQQETIRTLTSTTEKIEQKNAAGL